MDRCHARRERRIAGQVRSLSRVAGCLLLLVVTLFVLSACASSVKPRSDFPGTWVRMQAVALSVPRGFRQYTVRGGLSRTGTRPPAMGFLVTNYPLKGGVRNAFYKWSDFEAPPARRTALQVELWIPFGPAEPFTGLHLPLSLDQPWQIERAKNGSNGYRYGAFRLHDQIYKVFLWNGPSAPRRDRSALLRALTSIRASS